MNSSLTSNWKQLCKYDKHICVFSEALSKQFKCLKWTIIYPSKNVMHFFDHIWRISPAVFFFFFFEDQGMQIYLGNEIYYVSDVQSPFEICFLQDKRWIFWEN